MIEYTTRIGLAWDIFSPSMKWIAMFSALVSGVSYLVGNDIAFSASAGAAVASAVSIFPFVSVYWKCKKSEALALPPELSDRIYVPKSQKYNSFSNIAHEFVHNACYKLDMDMSDPFIAEGFATAMSDRMLVNMGKKYPHLEIYARKSRVRHALMSFGMIISHACNTTPDYMAHYPFSLDLSLSPKQRIESGIFSYVGGATMFNLAEYKYGKGIYKELFRGKYDRLLS